MKEHDKARPVSGEIMTGDEPVRAPAQPLDFSDAEYVTVEPPVQRATAPPQEAPAGMDSLKRGATAGALARSPDRHGGPLFWAAGLALVGLAFWVSGGHALVRQSLPVSSAASAQPLRIAEVRSRVENRGGRDVLFVEGRAENHGDVPLPLPPIEISVIDTEGRSTRYFLGTRAPDLKPGDRYSFSSRLEAPRNGVRTVSVTFQEGSR